MEKGSKFEKPKAEKVESKEKKEKKEFPETLEELEEGIEQYATGLKESIGDIKKELEIRVDDERTKKLREILEELEEEYEKLKNFINGFEVGDYEEFTKKDYEEE